MTDATAPRAGLMQSAWANPILLLFITTLIWAAHSIVGRLAVGQIGPMTLTMPAVGGGAHSHSDRRPPFAAAGLAGFARALGLSRR